MRLLIMGPQGVGKGTQAALLAEHFNIPTVSTGDIFRYNIKNKTELGLEAIDDLRQIPLLRRSVTRARPLLLLRDRHRLRQDLRRKVRFAADRLFEQVEESPGPGAGFLPRESKAAA